MKILNNKLLQIFLLIIAILKLYTSSFGAVDPPMKKIRITVKNESSMKIDSFYISGDSLFKNNYELNKFYNNDFNKELKVDFFSKYYFKIKAFCKDSSVLYSKICSFDKSNKDYEIIITNKGFIFHKVYQYRNNKFLNIAILLVIFTFFFKTLIFLFNFKIKNKFIYSLKYTLINIFYLIALFYILGLLSKIHFLLIYVGIIISIIIPALLDYIFHKYDKNVLDKNIKTTLILTNLFFYTIIVAIIGFIIIFMNN